ncbi:hypothetical protein JANAI62_10840 [Jannaschia pagri]|uniref:Uncharacterized protein n=1 Tax=Jannaschia pagri TaxID=2829797 RepID=A0ABQ4NJ71_9RHOB|nr:MULTISPECIES: hypothetical protein [unclassified Jannaschia]GIT90629.1 hypothetical protein JANAI61_10870 [Jannaschia sp. AI_61]GIT94461.1 hypothetical protein JANAI62_10840 [Jannaschia sp. AI_62]
MRLIRTFTSFLSSCQGAVTVDYVVLTAAASGVAIAASGVLKEGYRALSVTVTGELSGSTTETVGLSYNDGFDNGSGDWIGGHVTDMGDQIGLVLGPLGGSGDNASVKRDFELTDGIESTTIAFDLYAMDSHDVSDGDHGAIFLGDTEIGRVIKNGDTTTFVSNNVANVEVESTLVQTDVQLGGFVGNQSWWRDSQMALSITVTDPTSFPGSSSNVLSFEFQANLNQDTGDESFLIDNFSIDGLNDPDAQ